MLQEARIAAWMHDTEPIPLAVVIARRRVIDALRRMKGRTPSQRERRQWLSLDHDETPITPPPVHDAEDPVLALGLTGSDAVVAAGLAAGLHNFLIAEQLGVTAGRVSQIITRLRRTITT